MPTTTAKSSLGEVISRRRIGRLADEIAREFSPTRIILFGSYATRTATPDSDLDLLVLFKAVPNKDLALRIRRQIQRGFALDVIVMSESRLAKRLAWGDCFLLDVMDSGRVLYESAHA